MNQINGQQPMLLTIDKLIYGGDGFARLPANEQGRGKAVFLPFVLEGERVQAAVVEEKPGYVRARVQEVILRSADRIEPGCPYFQQCGGCHYQHTDYANQLRIKTAILVETLRRGAKVQLEPGQIRAHESPAWNYRNRTRMQLRAENDFALGYFRFGSHELLPVERCPISSPLINRAIETLWLLGRAGKVSPQVYEVEFFANEDDSQLLVELTVSGQRSKSAGEPALAKFAAALRSALPAAAGIAVFRGVPRGEQVSQRLQQVFGADQLTYRTSGFQFQVSAGSFFQTNRHMTDVLINVVTQGRSGDAALDLYAGTGLFSLPLAQNFGEVSAVEAAGSFFDLERNAPPNVRAIHNTAERFLQQAQGKRSTDLVVVDPPRSGLGEKLSALIGTMSAPRVTYVSCDPSTLARDLKLLLVAGFRVEVVHLIDLFPQTFHVETVVHLRR
ncbi:MAG: 23S rRNA (uracil(1939)-C(5))-methyltransferase RlmD [Terriglobales bacterium]